jgi:hypothetical protein
MSTPSTWLATLNWNTSSGGSAGSAETTSTLGTAVADLVVPPDQYHIGNLRIERMRQLLISMSAFFKGGTRLQVLAQTSNPFSSGEVGFYSDNAATKQPRYYDGSTLKTIASAAVTTKGDILVYDGNAFQRLAAGTNTHVLTADSAQSTGVKWAAGGGGGTLATAYSSGASVTDSTITLDSTRDRVVIKDAAMTIGELFDITNNGGTTRYFRVTADASQEIKSGMADGASAVAAFVDTTASWSNASAKLLSFRNNNSEKSYIRYDGSFVGASGADVILTEDSLGTTTAAALTIQNTTAAANGAQQVSPMIELAGRGWQAGGVNASQAVKTGFHLIPVQGTAFPASVRMAWRTAQGGASYADTLYFDYDANAIPQIKNASNLVTGVDFGTTLQLNSSNSVIRFAGSLWPDSDFGWNIGEATVRRFDQAYLRGVNRKVQSPAFSATMNVDPSLGDAIEITLTSNLGAWTISNGASGLRKIISITFIQDGTGSRTIGTPPAAIKWLPSTYLGTNHVAPTLTTTASARDTTWLEWDGSSQWVEVYRNFNN